MGKEGMNAQDIIVSMTGQTPEVLAANQGAATTRKRAGELAQSATNADHDPAYIRDMEDFKGRPHQEIYDHAQQMQPGQMESTGESWRLIGTGMQFATMTLSGKVNKSAASGWAGQSADAMLAALGRYVGEMEAMADVANGVGYRISSAALAAEAVKASVPAPPAGTGPSVMFAPGLENPAVVIGSEQAANDLHQEAVWAMTNHYVPNYQPAGDGVPAFRAPTEAGEGATVPGAPGNSAPSTGSPQNTTGQPSSGTPEATSPAGQPTGENAVTDTGNSSPDGSTDDDNDDATETQEQAGAAGDDTTAAGADPGVTPGSPGTTSPNPVGGVPGSGQPGSPGGAGGQPGSGIPGGAAGVPVAGRPVAGSPAVPGGAGLAGGSGGGSGGRAMTGMPGMAGAPGRRSGDQDNEHKGIPEWMINQRNTDELLGPREPTTPAVFGIDTGPIREGEWETVRRDTPEESAGPAAFATDQPAQGDWSSERDERTR
ncbi:PPE domain-containing protein [Nocardia lasii]|uniref:PPE domain-containing protein n=1 Tax=Nocardia lasii TaxID=1616107 RepID=A0ABW1JNB9_9NOCA